MVRRGGHLAWIVGVVLVALLIGHTAPVSKAYPVTPAPLAWEPDDRVHALAAHGDRLYVAGEFTGGIAAVDAATGELLWTAGADNTALAVAVSEDGTRVMAGGTFLNVNGEPRERLVALNAQDGSVVQGWRPRASGKVTALAVSGGTLYVGGRFGSLSASQQRGLSAVDVGSGQRLDGFSHYVEDGATVEDMAVGAGRLLLSGDFVSVDGLQRASIAAIDLATHALIDWHPARICSGCANYKAVTTDGVNAYVGSSGPGGKLAAFNLETGAQPWPMVRTDGDVQAASMGSDGYVYFGGHFQTYVGTYANPRTQMASVEAATGEVGPFNPVMYRNYPGVFAVVATPARLYVGGTFSGVQVDGVNNHHRFLAIFAEPTPPPPDPTTTTSTSTVPTTTVPTTTVPTTTTATTTTTTTSTVPTTTTPSTTTATSTVPTTTTPTTTTVPTTTVPTTTVPTTTVPTTTVPTTTTTTSTAPTPVTTLTVDASPRTVGWPDTVTVTGEVTRDGARLSGVDLELWARRMGEAPRRVTTVVADGAGAVTEVERPTSRTSYWWRLAGTDLVSDRVFVQVRPSLTIDTSRHRLAAGDRVTIAGVTAPSRDGTLVNLQRWTGERWAVVQSTTAEHTATVLRARRAYSFAVSPRASGTFRYRAVVPADDGRLRAVSQVRRIVAYDAAIKRVRPSGDELVVLRNSGRIRVNLKGWTLADRSGTSVELPRKLVDPGRVLRIHSGQGRNDVDDLYLRGPDMYGDRHDRVSLRDTTGFLVSRYRY
jgi:hypothetical protein